MNRFPEAGALPERENASRPNKRPRPKALQACDACRARRSRCDLIDVTGCHRCKQLGTACTLGNERYGPASADAGRLGTALSFPADAQRSRVPDVPTVSQDQAIRQDLEDLRRQVRALERRMQTYETGAQGGKLSSPTVHFDYHLSARPTPRLADPGPHASGGTQNSLSPLSDIIKRGEVMKNAVWVDGGTDPETHSLLHRGVLSGEELALKDPVAEGIVSETLAELGYQRFQAAFLPILPYHPWSTLHQHPFLRSVYLYYASCTTWEPLFDRKQAQQLRTCVLQNLNAYSQGNKPTREGIFAALILSLLPATQVSMDGLTEAEAIRMSGLAYAQARELGHSMCIERTVNALELGVSSEFLTRDIDDSRLYIATTNRHLCLTRCPAALVLDGVIEPSHRRFLELAQHLGLATEMDSFLHLEHVRLDVVCAFAKRMQSVERNIMPTPFDLSALNDIVRTTDIRLNTLIDSRHLHGTYSNMSPNQVTAFGSATYQKCHNTYCRWWIAMRCAWSFYSVPTPLVTETVKSIIAEAAAHASAMSIRLLESCLADQWCIQSWPRSIGQAVFISYATVQHTLGHASTIDVHGAPPPDPSLSHTIAQIRDLLNRSGPPLSTMLASVELPSVCMNQHQPANSMNGAIPEVLHDFQVPGMFGDMFDLYPGLDNWWGQITGDGSQLFDHNQAGL